MHIYIYIYIYIPQTVLALRGSYFGSRVIPLKSRIAGCRPRYLSPKVPKPSCHSPEIQDCWLSP